MNCDENIRAQKQALKIISLYFYEMNLNIPDKPKTHKTYSKTQHKLCT